MQSDHGLATSVVGRFDPGHQSLCLAEALMPGQPSLGLPELFFARDLPGFGKSCPARFALGHGRSPRPSQCGGPNLEGLDVKACTVTKPRDRAYWQWLPGGSILKPQGWNGLGFVLKVCRWLTLTSDSHREEEMISVSLRAPNQNGGKLRCDKLGPFSTILQPFLVKQRPLTVFFSERNILLLDF